MRSHNMAARVLTTTQRADRTPGQQCNVRERQQLYLYDPGARIDIIILYDISTMNHTDSSHIFPTDKVS